MAIPFPARLPATLRPAPLAWAYAHAEPFALFSLLVAALAVRWLHLFDAPAFPAVGQSVLAALNVASGQSLPLADQAPYLGAPFIYVLAGVYRLFGPSLEATLLVTWLLGALTVVPVYLLGKEIGGPIAGLVAGALMVTSAAHTVVSSHVPWVHSLTPLVATFALWLLARAVIRRDARPLPLAGLCVGLALQTHPTVLPLLLGPSAAALIWSRSRFPVSRMALFFACVILAYSPLLVHHLRTGFEVVDDIQSKQARYLDADSDPGERADRGVYLNNLEQLASSLVRLTAGHLQDDEPTTGAYLRDPRLLTYPALGVLGLVWGPRRFSWALLAGLLPAILLPPLLNGKYKPVMDGRYLMPLVPVLFVGVGWLVARLRALTSLMPMSALTSLLLTALVAGLTLAPYARLEAFYKDAAEDGASNRLYLRTVASVREARGPDEVVLTDPRLREVKMPAGATAGSTFAWLLPVSAIPAEPLNADAPTETLTGSLIIAQRDTAAALRQSVRLIPLEPITSGQKDPLSYRAYRVEAL